MPTALYRALYSLAEDQMGYVTTAQAGNVGVSPMALVMMAKRGTLQRVSRGVYRLIDFPAQPLAQYMQATLWPCGRRGVLSHQTALALQEISDVDPVKVHITLPSEFRVQRSIPDCLAVHRGELLPGDIERLEGMPITTPARTIRDCIQAQLGLAVVTQAVDEARRAGLLDARTAAALKREARVSLSNSATVAAGN